MNFLSKLLQGIVYVPGIVQNVEAVLGAKNGPTKKAAALTAVNQTISAADAVSGKAIADPNKFQDGLGKVIDGVVACLNASIWANKA